MKFSSLDASLPRKHIRSGQSRRGSVGNERVKFCRHVGAGAPVLFPTATAGSIYGDVAERGGPWSALYALVDAATTTGVAAATVVVIVVVVVVVVVVVGPTPCVSGIAKLSADARSPERVAPQSIALPCQLCTGSLPSPLYPRNARRSTLYLFTYRNISRTRGRPTNRPAGGRRPAS
jgi:hypothetical protein